MKRFTEGLEGEQTAKYALDYTICQELASTKKENQQPVYNIQSIYDEVMNTPLLDITL